jgi:hypothetical protein
VLTLPRSIAGYFGENSADAAFHGIRLGISLIGGCPASRTTDVLSAMSRLQGLQLTLDDGTWTMPAC